MELIFQTGFLLVVIIFTAKSKHELFYVKNWHSMNQTILFLNLKTMMYKNT